MSMIGLVGSHLVGNEVWSGGELESVGEFIVTRCKVVWKRVVIECSVEIPVLWFLDIFFFIWIFFFGEIVLLCKVLLV